MQQGWVQPWDGFQLGTVARPPVPSGSPLSGQTLALLLSGGLRGHAGSLGLLPALLLVGGLWMPAWLTQPLALGEAFVSAALGCRVSLRRRRGLAGAGAAAFPQPGVRLSPRSVPTQSCASSEDDSVSIRSRAASCATDSTSEDALSIRSEMIQRKGTRWGAAGLGDASRGVWQETWGASVATSQCGDLGARGE